MAFTPDFKLVHLGVNCKNAEEAVACAKQFETLFGMETRKDGKSSCFSSTEVEWMKGCGRGTNGHIALSTKDVAAARAYLEEKGFQFDEASARYNEDGVMTLVYAKEEIGGFAIHLVKA